MNRNLSFRLIWIVLAGVLACIPAEAQYGYSSIDIDSYGNIAGTSLTEVPYYFPDFGYDAYVEGILNGPGGEMMDVIGLDDGEGIAEVDTYGTASGNGDYAQWGYHEVVMDDGDEYSDIGTTDADVDWEGSCAFPTHDDSADSGTWSPNGPFARKFINTVNDDTYMTSFAGRYVYEVYGGTDDTFAPSPDNEYSTCPDGNYIPGLFLGFDFQVPIDGSNQYGDAIGINSTYVYPVINGMAPTPCGFTAYQQMWMTCPAGDQNYATNYIYVGVSMYPSAGNGSMVYVRGDGATSIYFPPY
jgi:hypothetical protein